MKLNTIIQGDCLEVLKTLDPKSVNMVMTSPPYWALRDYGVDGQLGLEKTFEEYITKLCDIFDEVKRVLRKDGTCWVNIGDTYNAGRNGGWAGGKKGVSRPEIAPQQSGVNAKGIPEKSLCMIPFRFAVEMVNRGWILRNTIIWHKPNCMPQSVKDRFTVDFEYLFFFVKSKKYWFETQFEKMSDGMKERMMRGSGHHEERGYPGGPQNHINRYFNKTKEEAEKEYNKGRNKRCVWKITTKPFADAHFAVYPEELCVTPIKAGCPEGGVVLDPFMGSGTTAKVARKLGRNYLGIELNPEYIKIAERRLAQQILI